MLGVVLALACVMADPHFALIPSPASILSFALVAPPDPADYDDVYRRATADGRPVLAVCELSDEEADRQRERAEGLGWHFARAVRSDGFEPGAHELIVRGGRLYFRPDPSASSSCPGGVCADGVCGMSIQCQAGACSSGRCPADPVRSWSGGCASCRRR